MRRDLRSCRVPTRHGLGCWQRDTLESLRRGDGRVGVLRRWQLDPKEHPFPKVSDLSTRPDLSSLMMFQLWEQNFGSDVSHATLETPPFKKASWIARFRFRGS
jgi:hypothetical protein